MSPTPAIEQPHLRRELSLWGLVFYGLILIQPIAPMPLFGVVSQEARGHVVTTLVFAMVAMLCTAVSYGRMAQAYPSAGSAYTYVGREIHSGLGFVTGWCMTMEYMLNLIISVIWASKASMNFAPEVPFFAWALCYAVLFTLMNLRSIHATARTNEILVLAMCAVVVWFLIAAFRYVMGLPTISLTRPFYDPATFSWRAVSTGTSIAVLTYVGFDGISTLSEEAQNPRRNIPLATVLTCLITGVLATVQVYAGQLVWPDYTSYPDVDTAFVHLAGRAGGHVLFQVLNLTLLVATIGAGAGSQLATARLLYAMGRDHTIPTRFFAAIEPKRGIPRNNVLLTGGLALLASGSMSYQFGAELLNFGAFVAFMGVNAAAFIRSFRRLEERKWRYLLPPVAGFLVCGYIWMSLRNQAKIAGGVWLLCGFLYAAYKTGGFRDSIKFSEPPA